MKSIEVFLDEIRNELSSIGAGLQVTENGFVIGGGVRYEKARFAQIGPVLEERGGALFEVCFQQGRFLMAHTQTDVPLSLAAGLQAWIEDRVDVSQLAKEFSFIAVRAEVETTQADLRRLVEAHWLEFVPAHYGELRPFFDAAREHPILRQLYWATSIWVLYFSRSPGLPELNDCPGVERVRPLRPLSGIGVGEASPAEYQRIREIPLREAGLRLEYVEGRYELSARGRVVGTGSQEKITRLVDQCTRPYYLVFDGGGNLVDVADVPTAVGLVVNALPPDCVQDDIVRYL